MKTPAALISSLGLFVSALVAVVGAEADAKKAPRPRLQIINGSSQPIDIFWLKTDSERVPNGSVAPGKNTLISTTIGHRFAIVGREDKTEATVTCEARVQGFRFEPRGKDGVPPFYSQSIRANGFPIVASAKVNPYALKEAAFLVNMMLAKRPDVREAMIKSGARLCVMAYNEYTTDLPEFAHLAGEKVPGFEGLSAKDYRDARARGLGGSETDPFCSCAEENVLGYPGDPYAAECVLIHEFAHNIHLRGMVNVDPTFDARLKAAYDDAMKAGLWKGKYPSVNHHEYFAEGVQTWFDNNRFNDHDHNHVHLRKQLLEYDPGLAAICREVFGGTELKYTKPATRLSGHMAGYDPSKAPTFVWPERLRKAKEAIKAKAEERDNKANGRETRVIAGWTVHVSKALLETDAAATARALELLRAQLEEIVRVVPKVAVVELRKVPLWVSQEYPRTRPSAAYHPSAQWLRDNGRDPAMARSVEFTNVRIFEAECRRMPVFALHELAHAYHHRVLGHDHAGIKTAFEHAKAGGKYDKVECRDAQGRVTIKRAYAMNNEKEYFAESTEAFFGRNDFQPFDRAALEKHDPEMFALLRQIWHCDTTATRP